MKGQVNNFLDSFLGSDDGVACISGAWGVGKTYIWNEYCNEKEGAFPDGLIAYSYISLFGKSSIESLRSSIFHQAIPLVSEADLDVAIADRVEASGVIIGRLPWFRNLRGKAAWINKVSKHAKHIPYLNKYSSVIQSIEYSLVHSYLICVDDVERKSSKLSVKEVMGFIDELCVQKKCKVLILLNNGTLSDGDKREYEDYKEKVIDRFLVYRPDIRENVGLIFDSDFKFFDELVGVLVSIGVNNIRLIKKVRYFFECLEGFIDDVDEEIERKIFVNLVLMCVCLYSSSDFIELDDFISLLKGKSMLGYTDAGDSDAEKKFIDVASRVRFFETPLDDSIYYLVVNGVAEGEVIKGILAAWGGDLERNKADERLAKCWDYYADSFEDNIEDYLGGIARCLSEDIEKLSLKAFCSGVVALEEYGRDIVGVCDSFLEKREGELVGIDRNDPFYFRVKMPDYLRVRLEGIIQNENIKTIDGVALKIATSRGFDKEDVDYLCSLEKNDFLKWMKSSPSDLVNKLRAGLLTFRGLRSSSELDDKKYDYIESCVVGALKDVAKESELNRKRVLMIYGVQVDEE